MKRRRKRGREGRKERRGEGVEKTKGKEPEEKAGKEPQGRKKKRTERKELIEIPDLFAPEKIYPCILPNSE